MKALLDVNVLIALFDADHAHHHLVKRWFLDFLKQPDNVWLSCAITQMGCIRIMSMPSYPNAFLLQDIQRVLTNATCQSRHQFVVSNIDLTKAHEINWQDIQGHRQLTDVYLLALASIHQASFVTLDNKINPNVIKNFQPNQFICLLSK